MIITNKMPKSSYLDGLLGGKWELFLCCQVGSSTDTTSMLSMQENILQFSYPEDTTKALFSHSWIKFFCLSGFLARWLVGCRVAHGVTSMSSNFDVGPSPRVFIVACLNHPYVIQLESLYKLK
jgi:hypothetical protein